MTKLYDPGDPVAPDANPSCFMVVVIQRVTKRIPITKSPYGLLKNLRVDSTNVCILNIYNIFNYKMSVRSGSILPGWNGSIDPSWTAEDIARARTLDARWITIGVPHMDRAKLVPLAVWKHKFPGLVYPAELEEQLKSLLFE